MKLRLSVHVTLISVINPFETISLRMFECTKMTG